jgi:predicted metalloendopeptidase
MADFQKTNIISEKTKRMKTKAINIGNLLEDDKQAICGKSANMYKSFEKEFEENLKKNKIDILSKTHNLEESVANELKQAVNQSDISPKDDFYSYINEGWLKEVDIKTHQQYIVQIDEIRLVQDKVFRELISIIENYISDNKTKNTKLAKCMRNAYTALKTYNTIEQTRCNCELIVKVIDLTLKFTNVWNALGNTNINEVVSWGAPFVWSIHPDEKNPKIYKCYLEPPSLTLFDMEIYVDSPSDSKKEKLFKQQYREKYIEYLNNIFTIGFGENHGFNVYDIYDCEVEMLNAMACDLIKEEEDGYNLVTKKEALEIFGFDWEEFCRILGFEKIPDDFVTSNINYLLCGTKLVKEKWNTPKWRTYWIYIGIRQHVKGTREGWKNFYEFEGQFLRGQEIDFDEYIKPIFQMSFMFNTFLTNEYIVRHKNQQAINYVKTMAEDLKIVFKRIITRNTWMSNKTKKVALDKLEHIKLMVGSPSILREDPLLDYKADDPFGNLMKIGDWRHSESLKLVGKPLIDIPIIDWSTIPPKLVGTQSYVVNAMYTPTENTVYIPLGYIQKPFVDLDERGIEYNLAHIGFTIAHELSHALDDLGSKYNKYGELENWWSKKDSEQFEKIQANIVRQYEVFAGYDGIKLDAWQSIGESLSDLAGFSICQEYLRDFQLKNEDILPMKSLSFTAFFIYFAIQSRQKISKKSILAQLKTNPHPLDKYRCNIPLSRSRIFRAIYNIKKGDKMWWNSLSNVWSD